MIGALIKIIGLVKPESIIAILEKRIPAGFIDMNRKALELGMELGSEYAA